MVIVYKIYNIFKKHHTLFCMNFIICITNIVVKSLNKLNNSESGVAISEYKIFFYNVAWNEELK